MKRLIFVSAEDFNIIFNPSCLTLSQNGSSVTQHSLCIYVITEHFDAAILLSSFKMKQPTLCWNTANYQQLTTKGL